MPWKTPEFELRDIDPNAPNIIQETLERSIDAKPEPESAQVSSSILRVIREYIGCNLLLWALRVLPDDKDLVGLALSIQRYLQSKVVESKRDYDTARKKQVVRINVSTPK